MRLIQRFTGEMRMRIKKILTVLSAAALVICELAPLTASAAAAPYMPPFTTLKIGLYYGTNELPSANLQNVDGFGSGFDFGYFDTNRNFVPIGAWTGESRISMLMDRNMVWHPGSGGGAGEYREGTSGNAVVGCFHVQINAGYGTFEEAKAESEKYQNSFVRYQAGKFLVLVGNHTSRSAAESAMSSLGVSGAAINSGTSNTITVTRTGTAVILFEFEMGATPLGVMPRPISTERPETWFRGFRYNGGFQYARLDGAKLTVVNYVTTEEYIKGIVPNEMGNLWPMEALKAQACCARTYAFSSLNRHRANGFDLCVTEHCQVYRGRGNANSRTDQAVDETAGMYITYNGALCQTYYSASNGGASENVENVWTETIPYLRGVIDPYEAAVASRIPDYYWTITYTPAQITERLRSRGYNCSTIVSMAVTSYTPTGNVHTVTMKDSNGRVFTFSRRAQLITALGIPSQRFDIGNVKWSYGDIYAGDPAQPIDTDSELFAIDGNGELHEVDAEAMYALTGPGEATIVEPESGAGSGGNNTGLINGVFTIRGTGKGHNVGMSQWGANAMASVYGLTYVDIIKFYYTGVEILQTGQPPVIPGEPVENPEEPAEPPGETEEPPDEDIQQPEEPPGP